MIIHPSPLPDVGHPRRAHHRVRAPDGRRRCPTGPPSSTGPTGRTYTYGQLSGPHPLVRRRPRRARLRPRRRARAHGAEHPRVRGRLPRRRGGRGGRHHRQPDLHAPTRCASSSTTPARRCSSPSRCSSRPRREAIEGDRGRRDLRASATPSRARRPVTALFGAPLEQVPVDAAERRRRAAVLVGHHRPSQGRDAHPPQPRRQHRPVRDATCAIEDDEVVLAVLPFFHIYGMQVLMNDGLPRGATIVTMPRFDLEQSLSLIQEHGITRSFVVPPIVLALAKHPWSTSTTCPSLQPALLRRGAAAGRARPGGGGPPRLRGRAGLRHDRAEPGQPRSLPGHVQARLGRRRRRQHRDPHRRPRPPARTWASATTASSGCAARR